MGYINKYKMLKQGFLGKLIIILILIGLITTTFYLFFGKNTVKKPEEKAALESEGILFTIENIENGIVYIKNIGNKPIESFDCYIGGRKVNCETSRINPGESGILKIDKVKATILPENSDLEIASGDYSEKITLEKGSEINNFYEEREGILPIFPKDSLLYVDQKEKSSGGGRSGGGSGGGGGGGGGGSSGGTTPQETVTTISNNGLNAEYYENVNLTGLKLARVDKKIDFDWRLGYPDASISSDRFSIRWSGKIIPRYSETYTFYVVSDDGVRLWVNNQLIIDDWNDHLEKENSGSIALTAGQKYDIKLEYYENDNIATLRMLWSSQSQSKEIIPETQLEASSTTTTVKDTTPPTVLITNPLNNAAVSGLMTITVDASDNSGISNVNFKINNIDLGTDSSQPYSINLDTTTITNGQYAITVDATDGSNNVASNSVIVNINNAIPAVSDFGLRGEYYNNLDLTDLKVIKTDNVIDFNWLFASPHLLVDPDTFSIRWIGKVEPRYSEAYTIYTVSDDGVRLWVNNQLIINDWTDHASKENSGSIVLTAGQKYDIKLEYYENGGLADVKLLWSSQSQSKEVIPESKLSPDTSQVLSGPISIVYPLPGSKVSGITKISIEDITSNYLGFDGIDDYLDITNTAFYDNQDISISMWINPADIVSKHTLITSGYSVGNPWWHTVIDQGNLRVFFGIGYVTFTGMIQPNNWQHVVFTLGSGTTNAGTLYVNGAAKGTFDRGAGSGTGVYIGRHHPTYTFSGWYIGGIDDVSVWNKALTQNEVQSIMNNGLTGTETGLISYWKFDEGTGQTIGDSKSTNHGTLGSTTGTDTNDPTWVQGSH